MSETNDQTSPAPTAAERVLTADEIAAVATTRRMIADAEDTWRSMGCFDLDRPRGSEPVPMKCCRALLSITERLCAALSSDAPTSARGAFFAAIARELDRAYAKHGREPWGRHEFYAILREEVDELWDAVKGDAPFAELYPEIVQVAAMCFRYIETGDHYAGPHPIEPVAALAAAEQNVARLAAARSGIVQLQEENVALTERLARAEADAARYCFMRDHVVDFGPKRGEDDTMFIDTDYGERWTAATIDEAVDAALRAAAGGEHA